MVLIVVVLSYFLPKLFWPLIRLLEPVCDLGQGEGVDFAQTDLAQNEHLQRVPKLVIVLNDGQPSMTEAPDQNADLLFLQIH